MLGLLRRPDKLTPRLQHEAIRSNAVPSKMNAGCSVKLIPEFFVCCLLFIHLNGEEKFGDNTIDRPGHRVGKGLVLQSGVNLAHDWCQFLCEHTCSYLAPDVQRLDNFIQWINHYLTLSICAKISVFPRIHANMHTLTTAIVSLGVYENLGQRLT